MSQKVTWKKGMRLTAEVFDAHDAAISEIVRLSVLAGAGGRYGLFPYTKSFELSVNISNNILEVVSLCCHGITKSGLLVDIEFDSNYTVTLDTRVQIPTANSGEAFILVVKMRDKEWREVSDMYSESAYTFELLGENSVIDNDSLPIGRVVNEYGWRLDETEFVPPCLYTGAHRKFIEIADRAKNVFNSISEKCLAARNCVARQLLSVVWPEMLFSYITIDKERYSLTPERLYALVQKGVGAFVVGCSVDEYISLENSESFVMYIQKPYDARHIYRDIKKGVELLALISEKMDAVCAITDIKEVPEEKPRTKPQSMPAAEPKPVQGKNRWDGIEI